MLFYFFACVLANNVLDELLVVKGITILSHEYEITGSENIKSIIRRDVKEITNSFGIFFERAKVDPPDSLQRVFILSKIELTTFLTVFLKYFQMVESRFDNYLNFDDHLDFVSQVTKNFETIDNFVVSRKSEVWMWCFSELDSIFERLSDGNIAKKLVDDAVSKISN